MTQNNPEDLTYGKVIGIFRSIEIDSGRDQDLLPDHHPFSRYSTIYTLNLVQPITP